MKAEGGGEQVAWRLPLLLSRLPVARQGLWDAIIDHCFYNAYTHGRLAFLLLPPSAFRLLSCTPHNRCCNPDQF